MKLGVLWQNLGNSVVYYPKLAKVTGGVTASVLFCQMFQWQSQLSSPNEWIRTSIDEIEKATGLSRIEQELARIELVKRSLLKERVSKGHSETLEFWVDIDSLEQHLNNFLEQGFNDSLVSSSDENRLQSADLSKQNLNESSYDLSSSRETQNWVDIITPVDGERQKTVNPDKVGDTSYFSSTPKSVELVEDKTISRRIVKTDKFFPRRRQSVDFKVTPNYQFSGPWESDEQFEEFQRALLEYFKKQGVEHPGGWVFRIVDGITKGLVSPFWDEFVAGIPLGESQKVKRDWEVEPGVPYPAFEEERIQYYLHKGEPLEVAVAKARSELRNPVLGKDLWEGFLRKCDRIADEAIKAKKLGVKTPYLPPSFTNKPQITKQTVGEKMAAISPQFSLDSSTLGSLADQALEPHEVEDKNSEPGCNAPKLSALQEAYKTPMGRTLVEKQIAEHPEWGYGIVDGQVVDFFPF